MGRNTGLRALHLVLSVHSVQKECKVLAELHAAILHQLFTGVADKVQDTRWQRIEAL